MRFEEKVAGKKILFITTKNIDYIRNTQELRILEDKALSVDVVSSDKNNYLIRIIDVWCKITRSKIKKSDIVFIGFEPQFVIPYVGWKFSKKEVYVDFFISVYDTLIWDRKKFKDRSVFAKYFHHMDKKTLDKADFILTDTIAHKNYFVKEFKGDEEKFETLYLEADPNIYYPRTLSKRGELKDKFIVLYFGSVLPLQGVDIILDAVGQLRDEKDIFFDIIGPITDNYTKPNQKNVEYTDWLSQEELADRIARADLCLAGHFNNGISKAKRTIAGKTYIYEMMGKKMILGDNEANHELFDEDENHFYVPMGDSKKLAKKICVIKDVSKC